MASGASPVPPAGWAAEKAAAKNGAPALSAPAEILSFQAFHERVQAAAEDLAQAGAGRGREGRPGVLALSLQDPLTTLRLTLAAWRLGSAVLPLSPHLPEEVRYGLLRQSGARWLIAEGVSAPAIPSGVRLLGHPSSAATHPAVSGGAPLHSGEVHLIVATSGSEGDPKAAMLTGVNIAAAARAGNQRVDLRSGDRWLGCLPLHHVGGLMIPLRCIAAGAAAILHDGFDPAAVWRELHGNGATHISLVPAMLARLLDVAGDQAPPSSLRTVLVGGGPLSASLAERALSRGWPLCISWGMTETTAQAATLCGVGPDWREGDVGMPLGDLELRIGPDGRIAVRGSMVMVGYANPALGPGDGLDADGWLVTGDLGRFENGRLTVLGRADDVLVTGGENVHPLQVETSIARCPGVDDVAVTAVPDPVWGQRLVALYTGDADPDCVETWTRRELPSPWRPRLIRRVDRLPRNPMGKLDRRALRSMLADASR